MKTFRFALGAMAAAIILAGCNAPSVADNKPKDLGGFRSSDVMDENSVKLLEYQYSTDPAGSAKNIERAFENAPPMIPHDLEGLIPITKDMNMCVTCHMPDVAKDAGATPLPKSHFYSIRNNKDLADKLSDDRFNCTQCHAPQANVTVPFKNNFKPEFRTKDGAERSNLLDILNDGVR